MMARFNHFTVKNQSYIVKPLTAPIYFGMVLHRLHLIK